MKTNADYESWRIEINKIEYDVKVTPELTCKVFDAEKSDAAIFEYLAGKFKNAKEAFKKDLICEFKINQDFYDLVVLANLYFDLHNENIKAEHDKTITEYITNKMKKSNKDA